MNNAGEGMGEINHIQVVVATEIKIPEELGWSKHKRVPCKLADALNGYLCGQVLDSSLNGVLECKLLRLQRTSTTVVVQDSRQLGSSI